MIRFAPRLMVLLLCGTTLAACATATPDIAKATGGRTSADAQKAEFEDLGKIPGDVEGSVRQAQLLRNAGKYAEAVHILSQLMLVASDDARVVGEYGKTLAQEGRASEAVQFLSRATELSPADWTLYSAEGVAYDQMGDQDKARTAYQRALVLHPGEPSVLNNYALSRMLANDPDQARQLIARAQAAGGASDPKIARNIALVNQLAPAAAPAPVAMAPQKPAPMQQAAASNSAPNAAPRPLVSQQKLSDIAAQAPQHYAPVGGVVMQPVPVDPLSGPVATKASHAPRPLASAAKADTAKPEVAKTETAKSETAKPVTKTADAKPVPVKAAGAKAPPAKPEVAKSDTARPATKTANTKPAPVKTADAKPAPVKIADVKPVGIKTAAAKPVTSGPSVRIDIKPDAIPVKTAANGVPALRMAAGGY